MKYIGYSSFITFILCSAPPPLGSSAPASGFLRSHPVDRSRPHRQSSNRPQRPDRQSSSRRSRPHSSVSSPYRESSYRLHSYSPTRLHSHSSVSSPLATKEIKLEWGKGLAQKREAEAKLEELEREKEKPFARTRDDPELKKLMKERVRWGDPMAHLKKHPEAVLPNLGDSEGMKESGFIIPQDIPSHRWLKRGLDAAPNQYGIKPGRHWDGVDRSNVADAGNINHGGQNFGEAEEE